MGKFTGAKIAENRQYENPSDPANSNYSVIFEITALGAVIDPATGKKLSATLSEQATDIAAAKAAAESASNAAGNIDSVLSGKAEASHTHTASEISGLPTSLPANGGNADTVGGAEVMATAALGLHKMSSGTAVATTDNCPVGCWYG